MEKKKRKVNKILEKKVELFLKKIEQNKKENVTTNNQRRDNS